MHERFPFKLYSGQSGLRLRNLDNVSLTSDEIRGSRIVFELKQLSVLIRFR